MADESSVTLVFKKIRKSIEYYLEKILRTLFFWEKDERRLGLILRTLHNSLIISILFLYIVAHTIFPSFILLFCIWCMSTFIFLFHVLTGGCLCTKIEYKLTGERTTIIDPILEIFHIPITKETVKGITILGSSTFFIFTSLELFFHILIQIKSMISIIF
jgi:hypothetical protein